MLVLMADGSRKSHISSKIELDPQLVIMWLWTFYCKTGQGMTHPEAIDWTHFPRWQVHAGLFDHKGQVTDSYVRHMEACDHMVQQTGHEHWTVKELSKGGSRIFGLEPDVEKFVLEAIQRGGDRSDLNDFRSLDFRTINSLVGAVINGDEHDDWPMQYKVTDFVGLGRAGLYIACLIDASRLGLAFQMSKMKALPAAAKGAEHDSPKKGGGPPKVGGATTLPQGAGALEADRTQAYIKRDWGKDFKGCYSYARDGKCTKGAQCAFSHKNADNRCWYCNKKGHIAGANANLCRSKKGGDPPADK